MTLLEPDTADRTITLVRHFPVPPAGVYAAWTEPDQLARWMGPRGYELDPETAQIDVRVGGGWSGALVGPDGTRFPTAGRYLVLEPPARIVFDWQDPSGADEAPTSSRVTVTFAPSADGTEMTFVLLAPGPLSGEDTARQGWDQTFDRLAGLLDPMTLPQGDTGLLDTDVAQRLLHSTELARVAYVAPDGTPRLFPVLFLFRDGEVVFSTFGGAAKIEGIRRSRAIAITIDTAGQPPEMLQLRGDAVVTTTDGVEPDYIAAHRRYSGDEAAEAVRADIDKPGLVMARIALRPTWVGVVDFVRRFPGGATAEEFANKG
ncbi:hypothetical protein GIS00_15090 [Nakamurella sp. YIM 132087]|uniref:SRPBCC domain-containing protein n=1 Tax=Nakamurella alba TaxID=2665158 RepID=A0A7K1FMC7_9ACTN|nr:SRPBCC domain-containing protein [Nakamurella alba]MTD15266.1 hypothetical protein [Nakamurella alba]